MKSVATPSSNRVLVPLGIGLTLSLFGDQTLYTVLPDPDIAAQAGVSMAMVGVLLGLNRLTRIVTNGPAGMLYDRLPRRSLMIAAMIIGTISTLMYAVGHGPVPLIVGRILWGTAWSGIWIGSNSIALDISGENNRGMINGKLQMWFLIGVGVSGFSGGLFTDLFGYRGGLWVSTGLTALAVIIWAFFLPETRSTNSPSRTDKNNRQSLSPHNWKTAALVSIPYIALRIVFAGVLASTAILWLSQYIGGEANILNLAIPLATMTGLFVAMRVLVSVISAPVIGRISDRIGRRWAVLTGIFISGAAGLWFMSLPILALAILGILLASVTAGGIQSLVPAIIGDQVKEEHRSRTLSIAFTFGDLGSALGPPLALGLLPHIGLENIYLLCAGLFILSGIFSLRHARLEKKRPPIYQELET
ncbi:MAG: MFS transporter [Anaerolineaceae bacterium]|nr:MFS transporter [Anaerolineaceae bacterium]